MEFEVYRANGNIISIAWPKETMQPIYVWLWLHWAESEKKPGP